MFFFFNDTATTEIYTLSLHDALPILFVLPKFHVDLETGALGERNGVYVTNVERKMGLKVSTDRKSTRLNSSHAHISYAVFCLKKKYHVFLSSLHRVLSLRSVFPFSSS